MMKKLLALAMSVAAMSALAQSPAQFRDGRLVDKEGMTLYTYNKDLKLTSNCYGGCAKAWPPLQASASASKTAGEFSVLVRKDGTRQWAYKGQPLYLYLGDEAPGDTTGEGAESAWYVAKP